MYDRHERPLKAARGCGCEYSQLSLHDVGPLRPAFSTKAMPGIGSGFDFRRSRNIDETDNGEAAQMNTTARCRSARRAKAKHQHVRVLSGNTPNGVPWEIHPADVRTALASLEVERFACAITSPPYFSQRDYKVDGQIGNERAINDYVTAVADSMDGVRRVIRKDGLLFLNLGDTYYSAKGEPKGDDRKNRARRFGLRAVDASGLGVPRKTVIGIPWRVALEMVSRNWILRSAIVWQRKRSIPEPTAKDRPWRTYEMIFMFAKHQKYYFNRSGLGSEEDIWSIPDRPQANNGTHFAAFPDALVERCLSIGCPANGQVLDPFAGSGTVLRVALRSGRPATGIDLNLDYCRYMHDMLIKL